MGCGDVNIYHTNSSTYISHFYLLVAKVTRSDVTYVLSCHQFLCLVVTETITCFLEQLPVT